MQQVVYMVERLVESKVEIRQVSNTFILTPNKAMIVIKTKEYSKYEAIVI